jgi:hypothetical protein
MNADVGISTKDEASDENIPIPLRSAQVWAVTTQDQLGQEQTRIKEVISYTGNCIEFMEWLSPNPVTVGHVLTLSTSHNPVSPYPVGAHGTHKELFAVFHPPACVTRLLILSAEKHDDLALRITSKVIHIKLKTALSPQPYTPSTTFIDLLHDSGRNAQHIYTDGSYDKSCSPPRGGGAVIFKMNDHNYTCIRIIKDIQISSVFDIELSALATARVAGTTASKDCNIYSDSKASLGVMTGIDKGDYQKKLLQHAVNQKHMYSSRACQWVQSHVELRKRDRSTWTDAESGNFIADWMAEHDQGNPTAGPPVNITLRHPVTVTTIMVVKLSTIIDNFMQHNSFSLRTPTQVFLGSLKERHLEDICTNYLSTRDKYRAKRKQGVPPRPHWAKKRTYTLQHTNRSSTYLRENSLRSRIIFNKSWTTGNQYRYGVTATKEHCPCCGNGLETQKHILFKCQHRAMRVARKKVILIINELIPKQIKQHPGLSIIIEYLRMLAFSGTTTELWTGLWSDRLYKVIQNKLQGHPYNGKYPIHTVLKLTRMYTDAAKELYIIRYAIKKNPAVTVSEVHTERVTSSITEYFAADNKKKDAKKDKNKPKNQDGGQVGKNQFNSTQIPITSIFVSSTTTITTTSTTITNTNTNTTTTTTMKSRNSNYNRHPRTNAHTNHNSSTSNNSTKNSSLSGRVQQQRARAVIARANTTAAEHFVQNILDNHNTHPHFRKRAAPPAMTLTPKAPKKTKVPRKRADKRRHPHSNRQEWDWPTEELIHPLHSPPDSPASPVQRKRMKSILTVTDTDTDDDAQQPSIKLSDTRPVGRVTTDIVPVPVTARERPPPSWPREGVG